VTGVRRASRLEAMGTATDAPRLRLVEPTGLEPLELAELDELLPGDLLEGKRAEVVDLVERRLTDLAVEECVLERLVADGAELRGTRFRDVVVGVLDAAVLKASATTWRSVRIGSGRVGSAELYDGDLDDVEFAGLKLGFVNLRGARLNDVVFRDCTFDELDVDGARLNRVAFEGCTIGELAGNAAEVRHVDLRGARLDGIGRLQGLRGATISDEQVWALAPLFAREAGFRVD
jgi:uncharacterized protein YjbI with pentapeptide repeats